MKRFLLLSLTAVLLSPISANAFWGVNKSKELCRQWLNREISTEQIIGKLGLYMPRSIDKGRALNSYEIQDYCYRTLN